MLLNEISVGIIIYHNCFFQMSRCTIFGMFLSHVSLHEENEYRNYLFCCYQMAY